MSASAGAPHRRPRRRILILSQFFTPEPCAAANRIAAMATALADRGHYVTVLTALPNFPSGKVDSRYARTVFVSEWHGSIRVERVWTLVRGRVATWASVAIGAAIRAIFSARYDAIIVSSPPITLALPALLAKLRHRARLVVDIRDVFPDVAIEMGEWKRGGVLARSVGFLAKMLYRAADLVVCVTPSARAEIADRGVPSDKLVVAANGFDAVDLSDSAPETRVQPGEFTAAYVGNMGLATGLDVVLDAAAQLSDEPKFRFMLVGGGVDEPRLRRRIASEGLRNVRMLGVLPRQEALRIVADAGACLVPLRSTIRDSLPTKLFDAMFVSCPIIVSAVGEARRIVEESGGGIAVAPGDGAAMADALRSLASDPARRAQLGHRGNAYVKRFYDRAGIMRDLAAKIEALTSA